MVHMHKDYCARASNNDRPKCRFRLHGARDTVRLLVRHLLSRGESRSIVHLRWSGDVRGLLQKHPEGIATGTPSGETVRD